MKAGTWLPDDDVHPVPSERRIASVRDAHDVSAELTDCGET